MTAKRFGVILFVSFMLVNFVPAKVYRRCELAKELKLRHKVPMDQLATWVCLAKNGAKFETRVVNKRGPDVWYGLFQINGRYWCDQRILGRGCGIPCNQFRDDDLRNDFQCAEKIYNETKRLKGDGFKAWRVYEKYCKGRKSKTYIKNCF